MHSYIEISAEALKKNIEHIRRYSHNKRKIIAVVKANAYGHGMRQVVGAIEKHVDAYAIDDIVELRELRYQTKKDIYVLGYISHEDIAEAVSYKAIFAVYDKKTLQKINDEAEKQGVKAEINIKIDALLGRQGVLIEDLEDILDYIKKCLWVSLRGLYSHFANIEDTEDSTHAQKQIDIFNKACLIVDNYGYSACEKHISSTAGVLVYDGQSNLYTHIRLGIGLYGAWPSEGVKRHVEGSVMLEPVLRWVSHVAQVKKVPKDFSIGYGCSYKAPREMIIAVVPQGYSDGYDRELSNNADVLIRGKRAPVCGRIAMNMFVVDVTDIPGVSLEDEIILIGKQDNEYIAASELAHKIDTIDYEIIARISPLLERRLITSYSE